LKEGNHMAVATERPLVLYHAGCWDGFCAAWVARKAMPDANFIAVHYGEQPPIVCHRPVFILDFSYKRDVMKQIIGQAHSVCVLDHHKSAQAELDFPSCTPEQMKDGTGRIYIRFDMGKSGGRLTWDYFFGDDYAKKYSNADDLRPWLVDYTEDRDLWRHELPQSRLANAALRSFPLSFDGWDLIARYKDSPESWAGFCGQGEAILRREKQIVDDHIRHAREIKMAEHKILAINATVLLSEIAGELAKGRPFGACYFDRSDGKRVWSLRSAPDGVDVSEIAKQFGGGGHKNAAGFEVDAK
jgi:oligoribonuclease NrnB/cAMP/cGMP phosphodiesterase (DHH superfamily)